MSKWCAVPHCAGRASSMPQGKQQGCSSRGALLPLRPMEFLVRLWQARLHGGSGRETSGTRPLLALSMCGNKTHCAPISCEVVCMDVQKKVLLSRY